MKIKALTPIAGQYNGKSVGASENEIVDWPDDADALRLIKAGYAEAVKDEAAKPDKKPKAE